MRTTTTRQGLRDIPSIDRNIGSRWLRLGGWFVAMGSGSAGATELPTIAVAATIDTISTSAAAGVGHDGNDQPSQLRFENAA